MPRVKRRTALKDKTNEVQYRYSEAQQKRIDWMEQQFDNWKAGAAADYKMLEKEIDDKKRQKLSELEHFLKHLPTYIQEMKVSEYIELTLSGKLEDQDPTPDAKAESDTVGFSEIDQELQDLENQPVRRKAARKGKKKPVPKTGKKGSKKPPSSLQTPSLAPSTSMLKDTPFMTPFVRSRLGDAREEKGPRMATEEDLKRCQTRFQLVTQSGSPIIIPLDNLSLARELQKRCYNDYMKVGEEWKKALEDP